MAIGQQKTVKKPMANAADSGSAPVQRGRGFLHEVIVELKKTTWPTPAEAWRLTMVVLAVIIVVAVYIGIIDFILSTLTEKFRLIK
jgi:preprotein translocase subunit SecE